MKIKVIRNPCRCGIELDYGSICPNCKKTPPEFKLLFSAVKYESPVKELVYAFKYSQKEYVLDTIFYILKNAINLDQILKNVDALIPVPMHFIKKLFRKYNHSDLIAEKISKFYGKKIDRNLKRVKFTKSQVKLTKDERLKNVDKAFRYFGVAPKRVLVIDDVATTLSTLNSVARCLKESGSKEVYCLTLAREF
ncbi:MAG: ComF family protein [bacterium]|nr:ComF family protein [bacterium]